MRGGLCQRARVRNRRGPQHALVLRGVHRYPHHYSGESTPYHFKVVAKDAATYEFSQTFKNGSILYKNPTNNLTKRLDSYAAVSAEYSFCIENYAPKQEFAITFMQGVELSDINWLPSKDEAKNIDKMVDMLNKAYEEVKEKERYSMTVNEYNMELQKLVSFKSVGFGFLSITVVLIISFLHYLEIKRVLRNRKII